jgi:AcrR family transcriptional regulator
MGIGGAGSGSVRVRRRGRALEDALYAAAVAELAEHGYAAVSMEGVAARAGTGKAALYRRWSTKHDLVLAALNHVLPASPDPDAGSAPARERLRHLFATMCTALAGEPGGSAGTIAGTEQPKTEPPTMGLAGMGLPAIGLVADLLREPALRARFVETIIAPRLAVIESILAGGIERGELDPTLIGPLAAQAGPALILQTVLHTGRAPTSEDLERILDTVLSASERSTLDPVRQHRP